MIKKIEREKIIGLLIVLGLVGFLMSLTFPSEPVSGHGVTATVATMISCTTPLSTTTFGTIDNTAIYTSTPDASTTLSSNAAMQITVYDVGNSTTNTQPGLYKSTATTDVIGSADGSYANTATLATGTEGYGAQATSTGGTNLRIDPRFNYPSTTSNTVGGLEASSTNAVMLASSSAAVSPSEVLRVTHKSAVSATNIAGSYQDTITYTCSAI